MLIDTHVHLDFYDSAEEIKAVVERAAAQNVQVLIVVGYDLNSCKKAVELSELFPNVYAVIGIHPHEAKGANSQVLEEVGLLATNKKIVGIGEIGLDFFRDYSPRDIQREVFRRQIDLAKELDLAIVIHAREAYAEVLEILDEARAKRVVFHCFSGGTEMAGECLKRNYLLSIAGPVTFRNARQLSTIARDVPLDQLLLETDSPFLAPHPYRGVTNEPSYLPYIARAVAEAKNLSAETVTEATTKNAFTFFRLRNIV